MKTFLIMQNSAFRKASVMPHDDIFYYPTLHSEVHLLNPFVSFMNVWRDNFSATVRNISIESITNVG
jgi:hypothetical protein